MPMAAVTHSSQTADDVALEDYQSGTEKSYSGDHLRRHAGGILNTLSKAVDGDEGEKGRPDSHEEVGAESCVLGAVLTFQAHNAPEGHRDDEAQGEGKNIVSHQARRFSRR